MFYDDNLSETTEAYYLEPGLYSSITDIVAALNTLIVKNTTETLAIKPKLAE